MGHSANIAQHYRRAARFMGEMVAETLWPTRCSLCDAPGAVLCESCADSLPYIDWWTACRRCGAPFGAVQCDLCNPVSLERIGRQSLPFSACASAVLFTEKTGRLVRAYKDQGERRLACEMATRMAHVVSPEWNFEEVTFVSATLAAYRRRGFDHSELLAGEVAKCLGVVCTRTLSRPTTRDQRSLSGVERITNLKSAFSADEGLVSGKRFLLVDDVFTTGSTLCSACDALMSSGAQDVCCLTFARV